MLMAGMERNVIWQLHIVIFTHWLRLHSIKGIKSFRLCLCQCILNSNDILHEHDLYICVSTLTIIGSDYGLSPGRRKAIIWTNAGILLIRNSGTNFSEISNEIPLRWRHNGHNCVSNHQPRHCLLNRLFKRRSKKTSKLRVTGLCVGNSSGTDEFPAQMGSNAENVSIWWRHHVIHFLSRKYISKCRLRNGGHFISAIALT